jgi:hypothetical protein
MYHHTPETTAKYIGILQANFPTLDWTDGSWKNDLCDSAFFYHPDSLEINIQVYLPNSDIQDEGQEQFNTFNIVHGDGSQRDSNNTVVQTIEEVIAYVQKVVFPVYLVFAPDDDFWDSLEDEANNEDNNPIALDEWAEWFTGVYYIDISTYQEAIQREIIRIATRIASVYLINDTKQCMILRNHFEER